jgi:hypothetical protein
MGKKLDLTDLKVQSFVTELDNKNESKIKGGIPPQQQWTRTGEFVCCWMYLTYTECQ